MTCNKKKEVLLNVIAMYKDMPYLWKKDHKEYMNKEIRSEGFKVLLKIYKTYDEKATVKSLKKKLENMRTTYIKELKRITALKHTGGGAKEVYIPSLWYFEALSFLEITSESCRAVTDTLKNKNLASSDEDLASVANSSSGLQKIKKKNTLLQKQQNILLSAEKKMTQKDEGWEVFGRWIGFQMKDLNKQQLTISQKIISDVIFYARLDRLSEDSYVVIRPPNEH